MDVCVQCGRQDIDTVDGVCLGCEIDNGAWDQPKGGAVARFSIEADEHGKTVVRFNDADGDTCRIRVDIDGMLVLTLGFPQCGIDREAAAFLRSVLDHYIATGRIPEVVPVQSLTEAHQKRFVEFSALMAAHADRLARLEQSVRDIHTLCAMNADWQIKADRRLAEVEKALLNPSASGLAPRECSPIVFHNGQVFLKP